MQTNVTYESETGTFTIVKDQWRGTFPISELPKWLEFYRQQRVRYPAHASSYDSDVKALEALAADLDKW
ncbi:MAG: hypothetical protein EOS27_24460 [Mesorhizobium sp.]|nr:MAG: hypothetical protein EOS27_24460 [Mesorhizobium sp.]TIX22004.1 MAG: hypothetical protein E5V35_27480 [Mesorhizobium sp.]